MAGANTEAVLGKPVLVQIILNTEANLGLQIAILTTEVKNLLDHSKKLEADVATVRNVNNKLVGRFVATEHQYWENTQYSRKDTFEVVGIPKPVRDNVLEQKVCDLIQQTGVDICDRDIQTCHRLKDKE